MQEASPTRRVRLYRMWVAQNGLCGICSHPIDEDEIIYPALVNVDHIVPRSMDGENSLDNLQLTHMPCNAAKGAQAEFRLDAPAEPLPPRRSRPKAREVRFVADGLDQGARVVHDPRDDDGGKPWVAENRFGGHVAINGKRFRDADVIPAEYFDRQWRKRNRS